MIIPVMNSLHIPYLNTILCSLIFSAIIIYPILGIGSMESFISFIILFMILFVQVKG